MRFHLLGVGSIGSLIAFHLKRSVRSQRIAIGVSSQKDQLASQPSHNIPSHIHPFLSNPLTSSVTLHLRRNVFARQVKFKHNNSIQLERDGVRDHEGGFQVEMNNPANDVVASVVRTGEDASGRFSISRDMASRPTSRQVSQKPIADEDGGVSLISTMQGEYYPPTLSPIDSLIVTTKCDTTLYALRSIADRIHPWSTIVLLQNGMGVMDTLITKIFKDPAKRPNFILATTTHGCFRKNSPLNTVHSAFGSVHLGVVPSERGMFESKRTVERLITKRAPSEVVGSGWERFVPEPLQDVKQTEEVLDIEAIPDVPSLRTLRQTVAALLALPLDVKWVSIREYQMRSLTKLIINACINPLTALADCKNGDLFGNSDAMDAVWNICVEASMVLEAQVRDYLGGKHSDLSTVDLLVHTTETGEPALDPRLSADALFQEVQRVIRLTARNWSSMHADIKNRRGSTEIDFINGYISNLARGHGIETTVNDTLTSLIKLKSARVTGSHKM